MIILSLAIYFENEDMMPWSKGYRLSAGIETAIKDLVGKLDDQHQKLVQLIKGDAGEHDFGKRLDEAIEAALVLKKKIK